MLKTKTTMTDEQMGVACIFWTVFIQAGLLNRSFVETRFLFKCLNCSICIIIPFLFDYYYVLLTYSTVQSPSWAADWLAPSQEIPRISRNPKVHHRTHKRTPPVPILGQPDPVHMPTYMKCFVSVSDTTTSDPVILLILYLNVVRG